MALNGDELARLVRECADDDALMLEVGRLEYDVHGVISDRLAETITRQAREATLRLAAALSARQDDGERSGRLEGKLCLYDMGEGDECLLDAGHKGPHS